MINNLTKVTKEILDGSTKPFKELGYNDQEIEDLKKLYLEQRLKNCAEQGLKADDKKVKNTLDALKTLNPKVEKNILQTENEDNKKETLEKQYQELLKKAQKEEEEKKKKEEEKSNSASRSNSLLNEEEENKKQSDSILVSNDNLKELLNLLKEKEKEKGSKDYNKILIEAIDIIHKHGYPVTNDNCIKNNEGKTIATEHRTREGFCYELDKKNLKDDNFLFVPFKDKNGNFVKNGDKMLGEILVFNKQGELKEHYHNAPKGYVYGDYYKKYSQLNQEWLEQVKEKGKESGAFIFKGEEKGEGKNEGKEEKVEQQGTITGLDKPNTQQPVGQPDSQTPAPTTGAGNTNQQTGQQNQQSGQPNQQINPPTKTLQQQQKQNKQPTNIRPRSNSLPNLGRGGGPK